MAFCSVLLIYRIDQILIKIETIIQTYAIIAYELHSSLRQKRSESLGIVSPEVALDLTAESPI